MKNFCPLQGHAKLFEAPGQHKKLVVLAITHYEIYGGQWFRRSAEEAVEWLDRFFKQEEQ